MPKMLKEVLKNLISPPATVNYPFVKPKPVPGTRGAITWDMAKCDQCQDCERVCPSVAIKVYPDEKKIEYHPFKCLFCYLCVDNCMQQAITGSDAFKTADYEKKVEVYKVEE